MASKGETTTGTKLWARLQRAGAVALATAVLASLVVGIPALPVIPRPRPAQAYTAGPGRLCSGVKTSGVLYSPSDRITYKLYVPANATVSVSGTVDILSKSDLGQWQTSFWLDGLGGGYYISANSGPAFDRSFAGSWQNLGSSGDKTVTVHEDDGMRINWRATVTVSGQSGTGPCTPVSPTETLGANCAAPNIGAAYAYAADPVNTATGNFHEAFNDLEIPGPGPGLALDHAYNSLQASHDGPLGYGWTYSYGMALALNLPAGTATVTQESGATVTFYSNGSGGWEAPPRDVATLVANGDGTYTFKRCNVTTVVFSGSGQLLSISDRNNNPTTLTYTNGKLSTVRDAGGRELHVAWTGSHITSVSDSPPPGSPTPMRTVSFAYNDGAGNLTDYTDAGGAAWQFGYDAAHHLRTMRRPRQAGVTNPPLTTNTYDGSGRVLIQTDELGHQTTFDYTSIAGATKVIDPKQNVSVEYYQNGVRTALTKGYGTAQAATWNFETDVTLGVTKMTDPNGHSWLANYDPDGNLTSTRDPLNRVTSATYNTLDEPLTTTDANGVTTTYAYDTAGRGNLVSVSTPLVGANRSRVLQYAYDPVHTGDMTTMTDAAGKVWHYAYDGFGDLTSVRDPLGDTTQHGYDTVRGWPTSAVSPRGSAAGVTPGCTPPAMGCTTTAHDAWGHVSVTTDPNGHQTTDHYDADGNLDNHIDADANTTSYVFDAADQLTDTQRPGTPPTALHTDDFPDGTVADTVDGAGHTTYYTYDPLGRLSTVKDPDQRVTTYGYDPAGNPVTKADPGGTCPSTNCTVMGYDAANQLSSVTYSDGVTPNVTSIGYDPDGRRTSMVDGTGTTSWVWDTLGRLSSTTDGAHHQLSYGYLNERDPATTVTYPGGRAVTRHYDDAGRLQSIQDWVGNTTNYTPDPDSDIATVAPPAATTLSDTYGYDNADQLSTMTDKAGTTTLMGATYGRDGAGQVSSTTTTGLSDTHSFTYTPLNQLQKLDGAPAFANDAADNLTAMSGGMSLTNYDAAGQLGTLTQGGVSTTFGYDTRGNRTSATPAAGVATAYGYDQANRLTSADPTTDSRSVSGGWYHSLGVKADGSVWAWGYNGYGQLGDGTTTDRSTPVAVPSLNGGVVAVAGASYESAALKADGTVWTWGSNSVGQLGDGTTTDRHTPVQVAGLTGVVSIAAGASHFLALRADGSVWAWGYNGNGQLGDSTTTDRSTPVPVQGLSGVVAIAGGYTSSVALKADGTVWAWGYNGYGNLGDGTVTERHAPVQVAGLTGVGAIAAGYFHVLATKADGTVWAWGYNASGQLGNNSTADAHSPVQAVGLSAVSSVAANGYHSLALKADASMWAWGSNAWGQFANGTTADAHVPQAVTALAGTKGVATSPVHLLDLRTDGGARAAGYNGAGELGNGTTTNSSTAVVVSGYSRGSAPLATYAYNGAGLRNAKTVAGVTTSFTWDPSGPTSLMVDDGINSYVYGPDGLVLEQVADSGSPPAVTWYDHDQLGSTRVLSSSTGATLGTATYDPYGRLVASTGTVGPIGFAGEYRDAETGFVYLRARYYDPATGQFTSRDPLASLTGEPYAYAGGSPLNLTDPSGLCGHKSWWSRNWKTVLVVAAVVAVAVVAAVALPVMLEGAAEVGVEAGAEELGGAAEATSGVDEGPAAERLLFHYTDEAGRAGIEASGEIKPGAVSGKVFVSPTQYTDPATAQAELSLPRTPTAGYFEIPESRVPGLSEPSPVESKYGEPGGGLECWVTCPVDVQGLKFIPWSL